MEEPHETPSSESPAEADGPTDPQADAAAKNKKMLKIAGIILACSFAFGWGSIPLYQLVCKPLFDPGGSSVDNGTSETYVPKTKVDKSRNLKVRLVASVNRELPWEFHPDEPSVMVHPGEKKMTKFYAKNLDPSRTITGKAVYDIVPAEAAPYLHKIQCFCFTKETFKPGESRDMPVLFWFDSDIPKNIKEVTIAYTFFISKGPDTGRTKAQAEVEALKAEKAIGIE